MTAATLSQVASASIADPPRWRVALLYIRMRLAELPATAISATMRNADHAEGREEDVMEDPVLLRLAAGGAEGTLHRPQGAEGRHGGAGDGVGPPAAADEAGGGA